MTSRFDRIRAQSKAQQPVDPLTLSGLSPSFIKRIEHVEHSDTVRQVIDSVVRTQWTQIHPDSLLSSSNSGPPERQKGELESALQQIKSSNFSTLLNAFREKHLEDDLPSTRDRLESFASQFQTLDSLLQKPRHIPLGALRDVTIELLDLPALAEKLSQVMRVPESEKTRTFFKDLLTIEPAHATFLSFLKVPIETTTLLHYETSVGMRIYVKMASEIAQLGDPDLSTIADFFSRSPRNSTIPDPLIECDESTLDSLAKRLAPIWNDIIANLSRTDLVQQFMSIYESALENAGLSPLAPDLVEVKQFIKNLPRKFLYVDHAGTFFDSGGSGRLHCVSSLEVAGLERELLDRDDDDLEGSTRSFLSESYSYDDALALLSEIAVRGNEELALANPVFFPEELFLHYEEAAACAAEVSRKLEYEEYRDADRALQKKIWAHDVAHSGYTSGMLLPGFGEGPEWLCYISNITYPPSVPPSLFHETTPSKQGDRRFLYVLTSQTAVDRVRPSERKRVRSSAPDGSNRVFYIEGIIGRIHRGKVEL